MNLMKSAFVVLFGSLLFAVSINFVETGVKGDNPKKPDAVKKEPADLAAYLQDISVTIHSSNSQGSGTIKTRGDTNYVWTAGHVVDDLRTTRQVIDPKTGSTRTIVEFRDAKVVKELIQDGRSVGRLVMDAEVLRYSDSDNGEDLALLRIRKKNFIKSSVNFYLEEKIPSVGVKLLHVGSLLGQMGSNSLTSGIMSQHGRVLHGVVYDQSTCAAFPGSSGGGVFLEGDGRYVGMIVRGAGETFNLMVPVRRMRDWAARAKVEFALDDSVPVPTEEELRKTPVEEVSSNFTPMKKADEKDEKKGYPFFIAPLR